MAPSKRPSEPANGFSLLEVLIAVMILTIAFVALAGLTGASMRGMLISSHLSSAVSLAQEKIEDIRQTDYELVTSNAEEYGSLNDFKDFRRTVTVQQDVPEKDLKTVSVQVFWRGDANDSEKSTVLQAIIAK